MHRTASLLLSMTLALAIVPPCLAGAEMADPAPVASGYEKLFEAYGDVNETPEAFMARVAPEVAKFPGKEAAGLVSADGKRFGVVIGTIPAREGWEQMQHLVPTDMVPVDYPLANLPVPPSSLPSGLPHVFVEEIISLPGETLDQFVMRIAPVFDAYTARTEWEACGQLAQAHDGRYGIRIGSIQAAMSCVSLREEIPLGMKLLNKSMHSHPRTQSVRPTYSDLHLQSISHVRATPLRSEERNKMARYFSDPDYASGPGYLVHAGKVSYQEGRGTVREVGSFEDLAPVRKFKQR